MSVSLRRFGILFLALALALIAPSSSAQTTTGTPPFASFGGGPDVINLANLNVHIRVPILQKKGRMTDFSYNSRPGQFRLVAGRVQ